LLLIGVAVDREKRRPVPVKVKHAWLLLRRKDDRLHGHRGKVRHNCTQLLQHGFGLRDIGNDEPCHASKQRNRFIRIAASGFLKIKQDRQKITFPHFFAKGIEDRLTLVGACLASMTVEDMQLLRQIETVSSVPLGQRKYAINQLVRITDGPFAHFVAKIERLDSNGRLKLFIDAVTRGVSVIASETQIEPVVVRKRPKTDRRRARL
jgi:transcription antitermination factor NusG